MNRIITIGREFGSGGREFGRRLSENCNLPITIRKSSARFLKERLYLNNMFRQLWNAVPRFLSRSILDRAFMPWEIRLLNKQ